ncbi:MAG TPA: hypothetical protein VGZ02_11625 [Candidatus Baltobacteraceae bacterium]|jgi:hypothetical protein|nr:hypothetical protein [Candidatus Baltobacteraceae bacterium]
MTTTGTTTPTGSTAGTKEKIVPTISSDTAGPLGAIHLPRLWAKLTLAAHGRLAEGYDECGPGFDAMTINNLNLVKDRVVQFVREHKPTYMQFEKWVVDQNGGKIDPDTIKKHNEAVRAYCHADDLAGTMRTSSGIPHDQIKDAVTLNTVEDLDELHRQATST